jgi:hypothetical protein
VFLNHFNVLISKIIFKKYKKYYFNIFLNKMYFKKNYEEIIVAVTMEDGCRFLICLLP